MEPILFEEAVKIRDDDLQSGGRFEWKSYPRISRMGAKEE